MKHLVWNLYYRHRKNSATLIWLFAGLSFLLMLYWGVSTLVLIPKGNELEASVKQKTAALVAQRKLAPNAPSASSAHVPGMKDVIQQFQEGMVAEAKASGCTVTQFAPDPTPAAYISTYGTQAADFGEFHARATITGNLGGILSALTRLSEGNAPFEISNMDISGASLGANAPQQTNQATVTINLQIVTKAPPPPPNPGTS